MEKQRPKAEPALRVKHSRYGYPVPRITPCATSCIKRVTPTSRSRLINVCEEHTSTASSFRLDRPERPTLVRKRSPRYQRIRFLLPSSLLPLLLCTESTKRRSKTLCRSRHRVLGGTINRCECTIHAPRCHPLRIPLYRQRGCVAS